ncbi:hypothetical protein WOLCODRAFT_128568 [Wolfiporia cocos MD-104 SS10]|uniref:Uncharacterized protein n=1 Tax=Wolfiporia cocos (strain MD-104) TaxID=742152 RepID=A0A2H3JNG2_WOLCO|nr:hypothetical protein WOLCODRAFT_128568 [Wolfiporia cocos MD-104 SS10]
MLSSELTESYGGNREVPVDLFLQHDFAEDATYQEGLAGIIASGALEGKSEEEKADIVRRSELFYFNRKYGYSISLEDARARQCASALELSAEESQPTPSLSSIPPAPPEEPRTLTFAELKVLIEQGKTDQIPNNRIIPNELNKSPPSTSAASVRRKPWEAERP